VYEVIDQFVAAIVRGATAGFDGVELHGGHAYLINQFLSPGKNDRDDEFGGNSLGRSRFVTEIIRRSHDRLGSGFPIGVRLSIVEFEPNGITIEDTQEIVATLKDAGAAFIDGSAGVSTLTKELRWTAGEGEATLSEYAKQIRPLAKPIPYMTVGRVLRPETAAALVRDGVADLVGIGRAFIADPDWLINGSRGIKSMRCIGCNGCQQRSEHRQSGCPVNPIVGHEHEYVSVPPSRAKELLVFGSGSGGLACAIAAASRGHQVTVANAGLPWGGLLGLRANVPENEELLEALEVFKIRAEQAGVTISGHIDFASDKLVRPEFVVDACPGPPLELDLPWPTFGVEAVLSGLVDPAALGDRVCVVGNGFVAAEASVRLAADGHDVVLLASQARVATDTHPQLAYRALERLARRGGRAVCSVPFGELALSLGNDKHTVGAEWRNNLDLRFDSAVVALGWSAGSRNLGIMVGNYAYLGDAYNPWEQRFVGERGLQLALAF
jgi:NADPH-dependent 2,4-dienoyl-CoA reductase/sulfur reductase-like enzyme